jgi:hypothetical protein
MPIARQRLLPITLTCCALWLPALGHAEQPAAARPAAVKLASAKHTAKATPSHQQLKNRASGLALATQTVEAISQAQLEVAARVLTGDADCEFNQHVDVQPLAGVPGYFTVTYLKKHYRMLPRETSTGAVRLEDPDAGMVWLQIPTKSMLMNARIGQRMIDNCLHPVQRAEQRAATDASQGLGIVPPAPAASAVPDTTGLHSSATPAPATR